MSAGYRRIFMTAAWIGVLLILTGWAAARALDDDPGESSTGQVEVVVEQGAVVGDVAVMDADQGQTVEVTVTSDEADKLHLHGYDMVEQVSPDTPVTLRFIADIPGSFDIELEKRHLRVAVVRVS